MPKVFLNFNLKKGQSLLEWGVAVLAITVLTMSIVLAFAPKMQGVLLKIQSSLETNNK